MAKQCCLSCKFCCVVSCVEMVYFQSWCVYMAIPSRSPGGMAHPTHRMCITEKNVPCHVMSCRAMRCRVAKMPPFKSWVHRNGLGYDNNVPPRLPLHLPVLPMPGFIVFPSPSCHIVFPSSAGLVISRLPSGGLGMPLPAGLTAFSFLLSLIAFAFLLFLIAFTVLPSFRIEFQSLPEWLQRRRMAVGLRTLPFPSARVVRILDKPARENGASVSAITQQKYPWCYERDQEEECHHIDTRGPSYIRSESEL